MEGEGKEFENQIIILKWMSPMRYDILINIQRREAVRHWWLSSVYLVYQFGLPHCNSNACLWHEFMYGTYYLGGKNPYTFSSYKHHLYKTFSQNTFSQPTVSQLLPENLDPFGAVQKWRHRGEEGGGSDRLVTNGDKGGRG